MQQLLRGYPHRTEAVPLEPFERLVHTRSDGARIDVYGLSASEAAVRVRRMTVNVSEDAFTAPPGSLTRTGRMLSPEQIRLLGPDPIR